ncbi:MAG: hypothetical protein AB7O96_13560 [Pseudobdellovibrionaceae bacterium]
MRSLLFAAMVIPTQQMDVWRTEEFLNILSNKVSASEKGLFIQVQRSASPLIFPLKSRVKVTGIKVSGAFHGLPKFSDVSQQGLKGSDDYALRIGIIVPGDKRLSGVKKIFASQWVRQLYNQVPSGTGLDHVHFFNMTQNPAQVGKSRKHPASDLMEEEFIFLIEKAGSFGYNYELNHPLEAVAVWISIDGDDTKSDYDVLVSKLELVVEDVAGQAKK